VGFVVVSSFRGIYAYCMYEMLHNWSFRRLLFSFFTSELTEWGRRSVFFCLECLEEKRLHIHMWMYTYLGSMNLTTMYIHT